MLFGLSFLLWAFIQPTLSQVPTCQDDPTSSFFCQRLTAFKIVAAYCYTPDANFAWVRTQCRKTCNSCSIGGTGSNGVGASCDLSHPCLPGNTCTYQRSGIPGIKTCVPGTFSTTKRAGRCPLSTEASYTSTGTICNYNAQCPSNQKCCQLASGTYCINPVPISSSPTVTVLIDGIFGTPSSTSLSFVGSVSLAQSNGYNALFDTAGIPNGIDVMNALKDTAGLYPEDIDQVVLSHGHSDHSANANLFKDTVINFDRFSITGTTYTQGPFLNPPQYLLNNDPNLVLLETPGHTNQDTTLLVKNVPSFGTYALTGDLFLFQNDSAFITNATQIANRKTILCQSQWILPGHGPPFQVTSSLRTQFSC